MRKGGGSRYLGELSAANDLGEQTNATPAISDGQIFLATDKHFYCTANDQVRGIKTRSTP